ncbi:hypothetical protein LINGRAHAP2_LOCUS11101 [Linum grandiflorum]
MHQYLLRRA